AATTSAAVITILLLFFVIKLNFGFNAPDVAARGGLMFNG
ncbi:MAG: hypothetical protein AUK63_2469, partial [bacterium P3]